MSEWSEDADALGRLITVLTETGPVAEPALKSALKLSETFTDEYEGEILQDMLKREGIPDGMSARSAAQLKGPREMDHQGGA